MACNAPQYIRDHIHYRGLPTKKNELVKWMFWYFMICQWQWHGIRRDITDPLNRSHAAKSTLAMPAKIEIFQKIHEYFFNDSGTECSAHIQRPANSNLTYHFLCKIKAILNFYGIFNDSGVWLDITDPLYRSHAVKYQSQPCQQK